jgi:large subunit ribosomal protein L7/L12
MSKVQTIVDQLKDLTLLEATELVKAIEETFGVSAAVAVSGPAEAAPAAAVEKTEFNVIVTDVPADKKISVIKAIKTLKNLGLAEAKALVETGKFVVLENAKKEDATKAKDDLSAAGATVIME